MKKEIKRESERDKEKKEDSMLPCRHRYVCPFQNGSCNPETCTDYSAE